MGVCTSCCLCVPQRCVSACVAQRGTGGICRSASTYGRPRVRVCARDDVCVLHWCHRSAAHVAAGASWATRTASAPWAARYYFTAVIDAAGAIYVIGGNNGTHGPVTLQDVWVSTDGGADRTRAGGGGGVLRGYSGVLREY